MASTIFNASLMRLSDSPTSEFLSDEMSNLINGQFNILAIALEINDLPVPGTPTNSSALGLGQMLISNIESFAAVLNECL